MLLAILILAAAYFMSGNKEVKPLKEDNLAIEDLGLKEDEAGESIDLTKEEAREKVEKKETTSSLKESENKEEADLGETKAREVKEKLIAEDEKKSGEKDKYMTDPVPEGKPKPREWQEVKKDMSVIKTAKLSVTCKTILNNLDIFNEDKLELVPEDGIIYGQKEVEFHPGESVFDLLLREMKSSKIHMEFSMTPMYNSAYIEGINNIYEFDGGELSGWMYRVNGWYPNYGVSRYILEDGDEIELIYTCDLGRDIGGSPAIGGE